MRIATRIALFAALAAACKDKAPEAPPAPPSQGIEVVGRGVLPQHALRYQLSKGTKSTVEMEVDVDLSMAELQRTMPTSTMVTEIAVDDVLPDGSARVRTTIVRSAARARDGANVALDTVNAQAMLFAGLEITATLNPRGRVRDVALAGGAKELSKEAQEQLGQVVKQAEQVALPLPEPAVGVGAVWRVRREVATEGVKMETVTEIEVTAIDGPRVSYVSRIEVRGDRQTADIGGVKVDVTNIRGTGGGKGTIDLSRMTMTGEQSVELGYDAATMQQKTSAKMKTTSRMRAIGQPAAPAPAPAPDQGAQSAP